jgi:hypothetical protein
MNSRKSLSRFTTHPIEGLAKFSYCLDSLLDGTTQPVLDISVRRVKVFHFDDSRNSTILHESNSTDIARLAETLLR